VFAVVPLVGFSAMAAFPSDLVRSVFHGQITWTIAFAGSAILGAYALGNRAWLRRLEASGRKPPAVSRYVQAFAEASVPTVMMAFLFGVFDPVLGLFTPPLLLYPLIIVLSALRLEPALSVFTGAVAAVEYAGLAYVAVGHTNLSVREPMLFVAPHHLGKSALLLACGVVTGLTARRIRDGIIASVEMLEDRKVVEYLNTLFAFMIDHVVDHGGIINKFLGDGFMAIFGAPVGTGTDCENALAASRDILATVSAEVTAGRLPPTRIGIALHAGPAITGQVGSRRRREYTVIGDVVNVAARIEALNKEYGSQLLISGAVLAALPQPPQDMIPLGPVGVRGRGDPIEIYKVV
jgi:adenylate cyclase